jgi:reversibly glycosylated polypeptide/UDP-arabinopyranose mutase
MREDWMRTTPPSLLSLTIDTAVLHLSNFSDLSSIPDHIILDLFLVLLISSPPLSIYLQKRWSIDLDLSRSLPFFLIFVFGFTYSVATSCILIFFHDLWFYGDCDEMRLGVFVSNLILIHVILSWIFIQHEAHT